VAGYREFVTGEVLTAANVDDFLAKQSVMKFADAAARDTALGTAVAGGNALREGMIAYLDDTDEVLKYDGSEWAGLSAAGIGSNVVQTVKADTFSTSSATLTLVTGAAVTITPSTNTSKVLVIVETNIGYDTANRAGFALFRGATNLIVPDSPGSRAPLFTDVGPIGARSMYGFGFTFLDSPGVDTAVTYELHARSGSGTLYVNRSSIDDNNFTHARGVTTMTAIEVAG
jgi:hypothetical protein